MASKTLLVLFLTGIIAATTLPSITEAQNCGCASGLCCSKYVYCGKGNAYCGEGCKQGPCYSGSTPTTPSGSGSVSGSVTDSFFNGIIGIAGSNCEGKRFYTRSSFLDAAKAYPGFGTQANDVAKREVAAAFAHFTHETGHFCYINEINGASRNYCDSNNKQWPCRAGQGYYGRGPIQISWNYNYGPAGKAIGFDGLGNPGRVATDPVIAFKTALWFWMNNCHSLITSGQGFGSTIRAINGALECNGGNPSAVNARINYYKKYCSQLGVSPGDKLSC